MTLAAPKGRPDKAWLTEYYSGQDDDAHRMYRTSPWQEWRHERRFEVFREEYFARLRPGARVLDLGCGDGEFYRLLTRGASLPPHEYVGVDLSAVKLRKLPEGDGARGDVEALPFADASFDLVLSSETIEHLLDPQQALREAARVLRPGGHLVLSTMLDSPLMVAALRLRWRLFPREKFDEHIQAFSRGSLRRLARRAGLRAEAIRGCVFIYPGIEKRVARVPKEEWFRSDRSLSRVPMGRLPLGMRAGLGNICVVLAARKHA